MPAVSADTSPVGLANAEAALMGLLVGRGVGPRPQRLAGHYGIVSSASIDQTTRLSAASAAAAADGVDLLFPPGIYVRTGEVTSATSWLGVDNRLVEHRNNGLLGVGGRISFSGRAGVEKIRFTAPATPTSAVNDAVEGDGALAFANTTDSFVNDCVFVNIYGGCVIYRNVKRGQMQRNLILGCYKDALHVTGLSEDIIRAHNVIEDGGDDALAAVGYASGGTIGTPMGLIDAFNTVRGVKTGRAFSYIGCSDVLNIGNRVDGTIPASYARSATQQSTCALMIAAEDSFDTFGNNDIDIVNFRAVNVGRGAAPFTSLLSAIHIVGRAAHKSRGIRFRGLSVRNTASKAIFANGGVAAGVEDLSFEGVDIRKTNDPLGYTGTANLGQFDAAEFQNIHNLSFQGSIEDAGAGGFATTNNCSGRVKLDLVTRRLNRGNKLTVCRGVQLADGATTVERFDVKLHVEEQETALTSGTTGFLDRPLLLATAAGGKVDRMEITYSPGIVLNNVFLPHADTAITVTATPFVYTNTSGNRVQVIVRTNGSTITDISRGRAGSLVSTGRLVGLFNLAHNETLQVTYSAGTPVMRLQQIEGI